MQRVWVVTPCLRDVASFKRLRQDVHAALSSADNDEELHVRFAVLDDSAGEDPQISDIATLDDVDVICPPFNLGHQRGLVYALRSLAPDLDETDLVITLDSDGEDLPADIPRLLKPLRSPGCSAATVVLARRTSRHVSLAFRFFYLLFRIVFRALTGTAIKTGNFAAYRGTVAKRLLLHPHFDLCYSSSFISLDVPIVFVPCARGRRYEGRSRMNRARLVLHGFRMMMPFIDRIALRTIVGLVGLVVSAVALSSAILTIWLITDAHIASWLIVLNVSLGVGAIFGIGGCILLFALFAQSRGISLSGLEVLERQAPGEVDRGTD